MSQWIWITAALALCLAQATNAQQIPPPSIPVYKSDALPSWLRLGAEQRTRYETISTRYDGDPTSDQQLALRGRFTADAARDAFRVQLEAHYTEVAFTDAGSQLDQRFVGGAWLTRANLAWRARPNLTLTAGRMTIDFGSRRLIARNVYRNTVNTFDGLRVDTSHGKWTAQGYLVRPGLAVGEPGRQFVQGGTLAAGLVDRALGRKIHLEGFAVFLRDSKTSPASEGRKLFTPGVRLFRAPEARRADFELEFASQTGSVLGVSRRAAMANAMAGYMFEPRHKTRISFVHSFASGDSDPRDNREGTFDNLFGARRFDIGPTGLYGLFTRSNLESPGYQFTASPWKDSDFWFLHRWMHLATAKGGWQGSSLEDPTGGAGRNVGQQFEWRFRTPVRKDLLIETCYTALKEGPFIARVLNRPAGWTSYFSVGFELRFQVSGAAQK